MHIITIHDLYMGKTFLYTLSDLQACEWVNNAEEMGCVYDYVFIPDPEWSQMNFIYILGHNKKGNGWVVKDIVISNNSSDPGVAGKILLSYKGMGKHYSWTQYPDNAHITSE